MYSKNSFNRLANLQRWFALVSCAAALTACGGGGSDPAPAPAPAPAPTPVDPSVAMRGFWSGSLASAPDGATRASAVVLPDGTAWVVTESDTAAKAVVRVPLTGTGVNTTDATVSGSGSYFRLSDGAKSTVTASGTASTANAGTLKGTATVAGSPASTFDWKSVAGFTTAAQQADVAATWTGSVGASAVQVTWTISAAGAVTGSSSTGCTYTGTATPIQGTAVYKVDFSEDCAGTTKTAAGIATLAAAKTSLRVVYTANSDASGNLIAFTK